MHLLKTRVLLGLCVTLLVSLHPASYALTRMSPGDMSAVTARSGLNLRFDLRLNSGEYGYLEGSGSEFRWSDPDGAPNLNISAAGHLVFESVYGQIETGMDDSAEYGELDLATHTDSLGTTRDVLQIRATEVVPNSANTSINEDSNNNGIFDSSDVTFENAELTVTDMKVKYYETGCCGDALGQLEFDGDLGFDGTKLRVWGH